MNKNDIRKLYLTKRLALSSDEVKQLSRKIAGHFIKQFPAEIVRALHTYIPITSKNEPDTRLITDLLGRNVPNINPTWDDPNGHAMIVKQLRERFAPSHVIVPLLAVDSEGNRIGFGGGYYDKFLSHFDGKVVKIGLSFFKPGVGRFPVEPHDIGLDYCVTPDGIYNFDLRGG